MSLRLRHRFIPCVAALAGGASTAPLFSIAVRHQSQGTKGRQVTHVEGEMRPEYASENRDRKLNIATMPHYVKATIQQERREQGLTEIDNWEQFAEEALMIRTRSGTLWVGPDDPRAFRVMRRREKLAAQPNQITRAPQGPDPAVALESHPLRIFFTSPSDLRDPLSIAEGLWKSGYIKDFDVKFTASKMKWVPRPPIVTIMGHVDHGKTTLLDYLRKSNVAAGEVGGITQSIGAFTVRSGEQQQHVTTFVDTPGHAAFTDMRKAGAAATDLVVLVVSASDGVQVTTREVVTLTKELHLPVVVAINKIDKLSDVERGVAKTKNELRELGLHLEDDKGDVQCVPISARDGTGIEDLLEAIQLQAAMSELVTPTPSRAEVLIIDSHLNSEQSSVAGIVRCGTLKPGMTLAAGLSYATVSAITDPNTKKPLASAGPSTPVLLSGFKLLPKPGNVLMQLGSLAHGENFHRLMSEVYKVEGKREAYLQYLSADARGQFYNRKPHHDMVQFHERTELYLVVKAATFGQLQALLALVYALPSLDEVHLVVRVTEVGGLTDHDVLMANNQKKCAILIFGDAPDQNRVAVPSYIEVNRFKVVYHGIQWLKERMVALMPKLKKERIVAQAICKQTFRASQAGSGNAAGMEVTAGTVLATALFVRVMRRPRGAKEREAAEQAGGTGVVTVYEGSISELRRFKDIVPSVESGLECGVILRDFVWQEGDILQVVEFDDAVRDVDEVFYAAEQRDEELRQQAQRTEAATAAAAPEGEGAAPAAAA